MTLNDDQLAPQERTQFTGGSVAAAADFRPGQIIGNDYQVLAWIGAGGMGNVYRVQHTILQTEYALKTLSADKITDTAWRRFQNEAQAIGRMNHANIVAVYNLGLHEDRLPYYVMDLLKGQTLMDLIKADGPLEVEEAVKIFIEVCAGLGYAHAKGIVHRDIKPPNIVLIDKPISGGSRVKIVDFGIAKLTAMKDETIQRLTNVGEICGSPYYMSPEQCDGARVDARSDIYSFGCTLFEVLTGSPPYKGRNAMETMMLHQSAEIPSLSSTAGGKAFPDALERSICMMLAKEPLDRYQSMDDVSADLANILKGRRKAKTERPQAPIRQTQETRRPAKSDSQLRTSIAREGPAINVTLLALTAVLIVGAAAGGVIFCLKTSPNKSTVAPPPPLLTANGKSKLAPQKNFWPGDNEVASLTAPSATAGGTTFIAENEGKSEAPSSEALPPPDKTAMVSIVKDASGLDQFICNFPKTQSLGTLLLDSPIESATAKAIDCQGEQKIPTGHRLYFLPSLQCTDQPLYFQKFAPAPLYSIAMPPMAPNSSREFQSVMTQLQHLSGLKRLELQRCNTRADEVLRLLDQCDQVDELVLDANSIPAHKLIKSKIITRLKDLKYSCESNSINNVWNREKQHWFKGGHKGEWEKRDDKPGKDEDPAIPEISKVLDCLSHSENLQSLEIPKFSLLPPDFMLIGKIKNLRQLDLSKSNMFDVNVQLLTSLKHLAVFHVDDCLIGAEAIPFFKKMHSLKEIHMRSPSMSPEIVKLYKESLPGVKIDCQTN
jgi:serine/threonine protein kinase